MQILLKCMPLNTLSYNPFFSLENKNLFKDLNRLNWC